MDILSNQQIQLLDLPVGSIVLIEITTPHLESYKAGLGKAIGQITITDDGYTLRIDSETEETTEACEYLQSQFNDGCKVRFALPENPNTWYFWQSNPWEWGELSGIKTLLIPAPS